jgi:hypothetical protein
MLLDEDDVESVMTQRESGGETGEATADDDN